MSNLNNYIKMNNLGLSRGWSTGDRLSCRLATKSSNCMKLKEMTGLAWGAGQVVP